MVAKKIVPEYRSVSKELERERRRDRIRNVGDAKVKVGQFDFEDVADQDLELMLVGAKELHESYIVLDELVYPQVSVFARIISRMQAYF